MCERQREICAEEAKVDWSLNAWYVDKESITNAPLPEEIQEPKGLKKLLKTWKAEELKLISEEVKDYLLELFSNQSSELLNEKKIKLDVYEDSGVFSVLVGAGKTSYLTGVLGFLMYQPHQDILAVTYNGLILNKEQIEELFLRKERDYLPSNNTHD